MPIRRPAPKFGTGGRAGPEFFSPPRAGAQEFAAAVLVQPDGKIVVVGFSENNTTGQVFIALARYNG